MSLRIAFIIFFISVSSVSAEVLTTPPENPSKEKKYFFFMHGSGLFGDYADRARDNWQDKAHTISSKGFTVITEERHDYDLDHEYAIKVAEYVDTLIKKGIAAKNITVGGYSRGSRIALRVANILLNPDINYFLLAGCYYEDELGADMKGRILSVYDSGDTLFNSCFSLENQNGITYKEVIVDTGYEHSMGAEVRSDWMDPFLAWIKK